LRFFFLHAIISGFRFLLSLLRFLVALEAQASRLIRPRFCDHYKPSLERQYLPHRFVTDSSRPSNGADRSRASAGGPDVNHPWNANIDLCGLSLFSRNASDRATLLSVELIAPVSTIVVSYRGSNPTISVTDVAIPSELPNWFDHDISSF
jgi:hypothetical protein